MARSWQLHGCQAQSTGPVCMHACAKGILGALETSCFAPLLTLTLPCSPAVILSYLIGGLVAFITACKYSELGADYPLPGASFNYVLAVWGEFPAWITIVAIAIGVCPILTHSFLSLFNACNEIATDPPSRSLAQMLYWELAP